MPAIDVMALDDGVFVRSWGNADLDLRVGLCERGEVVLQKGAATIDNQTRSE